MDQYTDIKSAIKNFSSLTLGIKGIKIATIIFF